MQEMYDVCKKADSGNLAGMLTYCKLAKRLMVHLLSSAHFNDTAFSSFSSSSFFSSSWTQRNGHGFNIGNPDPVIIICDINIWVGRRRNLLDTQSTQVNSKPSVWILSQMRHADILLQTSPWEINTAWMWLLHVRVSVCVWEKLVEWGCPFIGYSCTTCSPGT